MSWDFLAPERLWLLLVVGGLAVAYVVVPAASSRADIALHADRDARSDRPQASRLATSLCSGGATGCAHHRCDRRRPTGRPRDDTFAGRRQDHHAVRRLVVDAGRRRRTQSVGSGEEGRRRLRRCGRRRHRSRPHLLQRHGRCRGRADNGPPATDQRRSRLWNSARERRSAMPSRRPSGPATRPGGTGRITRNTRRALRWRDHARTTDSRRSNHRQRRQRARLHDRVRHRGRHRSTTPTPGCPTRFR